MWIKEGEKMAENLILCSFLGICSCYDLKLRKIPGWLLYTGILLGTLYWGILKMAGQVSWAALPVSLLPGCLLYTSETLSGRNKERLKYEGQVIFLPYIPDQDLSLIHIF